VKLSHKAFGTVDHSNLLRILREFGFSGSVLLRFQSYLSGRFQRVTVVGATSQSLPITSGVPQGSLLSPFLFSVYINDLPNHVSSSTGVGLFADDTKLYKAVQNLLMPCFYKKIYGASNLGQKKTGYVLTILSTKYSPLQGNHLR
jgi:hypothetical protein